MNALYSFIIVEDVALQREHLIDLLHSRLDLRLLEAFDNAEDAFLYLKDDQQPPPDIIFLDIEMPEASGFNLLEVTQQLPQQPKVIITTAFAEYAVKGYDYNLSGYLLKPIEEEQLNKAVQKVIQQLERDRTPAMPHLQDPHLLIKSKSKWVKLGYDEILYVEGANVDVRIVTPAGTYLTRDRIKNLQQKLPSDSFMRIHDSFLVNLTHIRSYASNYTFLELRSVPDGAAKKLPVGPKYRELFRESVGPNTL
ncbi:MAG: LytTR family DNA-binding domain-containing protein [Phaeodactylibacter sp.]|uniref:LytR/AlgR family response regulator transcription factor n=1 Tax=Phaeodactylibacter sp. TaxID=1940289 RepID=UPI0032EC1F79